MSSSSDIQTGVYPEHIICNETFKIDGRIATDWLQWMKTEYIPQIIATGCFTRAVILRLLGVDEADGPTYAVQYFALTLEHYEKYNALFAGESGVLARGRWGDAFVSFSSVLEVVN